MGVTCYSLSVITELQTARNFLLTTSKGAHKGGPRALPVECNHKAANQNAPKVKSASSW